MKKTLFFVPFLLIFIGFVKAQNVEEIIAKHLEAVGSENWKYVEALKTEGDLLNVIYNVTGSTTSSHSILVVRDKAVRIDDILWGETTTFVLNGDTGWFTMPAVGQSAPELLPDAMVGMMKSQTQLLDTVFTDYKAQGAKFEYMGTENINGTEAIKIKMYVANNYVMYSFFDPATFYEIKRVVEEDPEKHYRQWTTIYSNFKKQNGIVFPFTIETTDSMMGVNTYTISSITVNPVVDPQIFEMPK